jgi:hypothetical protein
MITIPLLASALAMLPMGVEVDCSTWLPIARVQMKIVVTSSDGKKIETGKITISRSASSGAVQDTLVAAMEVPGWVVKAGPGDTVIVFAPKGKSVTSIRFDSDGWVPVYRKVPAVESPKIQKPNK